MATFVDYDSVLRAVSAWPTEQRASLAHALIDSLKTPPRATAPASKPSLEEFIGAARGDGPAPNDEQVAAWIGEHRLGKYGR